MTTQKIVRFYNWQDWRNDAGTEAGLGGSLGSNVTNRSFLKLAAIEAENESNEVWLLAATKVNRWRVSAWIRLRKRLPNEPKQNARYATLVYYDLNASLLHGDINTGKLREIPAIDDVLKSYGKRIEQEGNAGFEFKDEHARRILRAMQSVGGIPFSAFVKQRSRLETQATLGIVEQSSKQGYPETNNGQPTNSDLLETTSIGNNQFEDLQSDLEIASKCIDTEYTNRPGEDVDAIVKRRIGQGSFRSLLEAIYGESCCVSGLDNKRLLIASHIIPWSKATPTQKTDPDNGLLLSVCWDAVFDKGFVSFADDGAALFSDQIDEPTQRVLGISMTARLPSNLLTQRRKENLSWHRKKHGFEL
jgi:hypothetical protein